MTDDLLEQQVLNLLQEMHQRYEAANQTAHQLLVNPLSAEELEAASLKLQTETESFAKLDSESQPIRQAYRASREHASEAVSQATHGLSRSMQSLLMKLNQLEQRALNARSVLLPKINEGVRAVQMKNAYGKYL